MRHLLVKQDFILRSCHPHGYKISVEGSFIPYMHIRGKLRCSLANGYTDLVKVPLCSGRQHLAWRITLHLDAHSSP